jgi:heme exporter protein A
LSLPPLLETKALGVSFGSRVALRDVGISIRRGEVLALFGPNGAGKTTLLRILSTLLRPTRGHALLEGLDLSSRRLRVEARRRIGFLSHQTMLYDRLTAMENLLFYARMYRVPSPESRCLRLLQEVGLSGREEDLAGEYSRGMQQRLAIARALIHDPELLLLDEPFSGLDPQASAFLFRLLQDLRARGKTLVFTSHDLEAGLSLCHRAAILVRGAMAFDSPRSAIDPRGFPGVYDSVVASRPRGG